MHACMHACCVQILVKKLGLGLQADGRNFCEFIDWHTLIGAPQGK